MQYNVKAVYELKSHWFKSKRTQEMLINVHNHMCVFDFLLSGVDFKIKTVELRGKKIRLQIWWVIVHTTPVPLLPYIVHFLRLSLSQSVSSVMLQTALTQHYWWLSSGCISALFSRWCCISPHHSMWMFCLFKTCETWKSTILSKAHVGPVRIKLKPVWTRSHTCHMHPVVGVFVTVTCPSPVVL